MESIIHCEVQEEWFDKLLCGCKRVEIRLAKGKWTKVKEGSTLRICEADGLRTCSFTVAGMNYWKTFTEALEKFGVGNVLPGIQSTAEGVAIYEKMYGVEEKDLEMSVVSFELAACQKDR